MRHPEPVQARNPNVRLMGSVMPPRNFKETVMYSIKTILTAASLAVLAAAGSAEAAPWEHHRPDPYFNRVHQPIVMRERVFDALRLHHYRGVADPVFIRGHYVVKSFDRMGRVVFVEVDPYTGAFLGEIRI
jgi:hypothetical protein